MTSLPKEIGESSINVVGITNARSNHFRIVLDEALNQLREQVMLAHDRELDLNDAGPRSPISAKFSMASTGNFSMDRNCVSVGRRSSTEVIGSGNDLDLRYVAGPLMIHQQMEDKRVFNLDDEDVTFRSSPILINLDATESDTNGYSRCHAATGNPATVLARWRFLYDMLMEFHRRHVEQGQNQFKVDSSWLPYLAKLREGDETCRCAISKALVDIVTGRLQHEVSLLHSLDTFEWKLRPIHPSSFIASVLILAKLAFLGYDAVAFPYIAFFSDDSKVSVPTWIVLWTATVFWTLDMFLSFMIGTYIRGDLVMTFRLIRHNYVRTWLALDACCVLFEWALQVAELLDPAHFLAHALRYGCLARIPLRFFKLNHMLEGKLSTSPIGFLLYGSMFRLILMYMVLAHAVACLWYGIGRWSDNNFWARREELGLTNWLASYLTALHWSVSHIHGTNTLVVVSTLEKAFQTCWLWCSFVLFSIFVARVVHHMEHRHGRTSCKLIMRCARWTSAHGISPELAHQAMDAIMTSISDDSPKMDQRIAREASLLKSFPKMLQEDLLQEARTPILSKLLFLKELGWACPGVIRSLCVEALQLVSTVAGEIVFSSGDMCLCVRFVDSGKLFYTPQGTFHSEASRAYSKRWSGLGSSMGEGIRTVCSSQYLSEPTLWTFWQHRGSLVCATASLIVELSQELFIKVMQRRVQACLLAARHAHRFVRCLNQASDLSDLIRFNYFGDNRDGSSHSRESISRWFIFISHFKVEAGTEATLLQGMCTDLLEEVGDVSTLSPLVFLDSENLQDLNSLVDHVSRSDNLVVLLTPKVLKRPWCVVEIVEACRHGVPLVPVEIVRPDLKFVYPSDKLYQQIVRGDFYTSSDMKIFRSFNIKLSQVEHAIRSLFKQIALHFSPHRHKAVRGAEIDAILARCKQNAAASQPMAQASAL